MFPMCHSPRIQKLGNKIFVNSEKNFFGCVLLVIKVKIKTKKDFRLYRSVISKRQKRPFRKILSRFCFLILLSLFQQICENNSFIKMRKKNILKVVKCLFHDKFLTFIEHEFLSDIKKGKRHRFLKWNGQIWTSLKNFKFFFWINLAIYIKQMPITLCLVQIIIYITWHSTASLKSTPSASFEVSKYWPILILVFTQFYLL